MEKEIRIFDSSNRVLKVKGIRFDLLEVNSGALIDTKNSDDLNPIAGGSNDWGVKLSFSTRSGPLEVYTSDPNYRYPGNTIQTQLRGFQNKCSCASMASKPSAVLGTTRSGWFCRGRHLLKDGWQRDAEGAA
jgi:hypothetical protein